MTVWYLTTGGDILHGFIFSKPCIIRGGARGITGGRGSTAWPWLIVFGFKGNHNVFNQKAHSLASRDWRPWFLQAKTARATDNIIQIAQVDSSYGNGKVFTYYSTWWHNIRLGPCGKKFSTWFVWHDEGCRIGQQRKEDHRVKDGWAWILGLPFFEFLVTGHSLFNTTQQGTHSYPSAGNGNGWSQKKAVKRIKTKRNLLPKERDLVAECKWLEVGNDLVGLESHWQLVTGRLDANANSIRATLGSHDSKSSCYGFSFGHFHP